MLCSIAIIQGQISFTDQSVDCYVNDSAVRSSL